MSEPKLSGFHHVTLNVHDVERSERWYRDVLGFTRLSSVVNDAFTRVIMRHPEGGLVLALNRHDAPPGAEPFDERRAGLDHLAFQVPDREALDDWASRFDERGVPHSEIKAAAVPGAFLIVFRDPDDIQLEVFAAGTP